jgi:hypothetical protein
MIQKVCAALIVFTIAALVIAGAIATSIPSTPEFTTQYLNRGYDVSPQTTTDPFTGETVVTNAGGHFDNWTIAVIIKNQQFTSVKDENGNYTTLYYTLRFKGHYQEEWQYYPANPSKGETAPLSPFDYDSRSWSFISASTVEVTIVDLPIWRIGSIPENGQVDIQVQALIGHDNMQRWGPEGMQYTTYFFDGQSSGWSNTQTLTITKNGCTIAPTNSPPPSAIPSIAPTQAPTTIPEVAQIEIVDWKTIAIIGLAVAVAVLALGLLVVWRRLASIKKPNMGNL